VSRQRGDFETKSAYQSKALQAGKNKWPDCGVHASNDTMVWVIAPAASFKKSKISGARRPAGDALLVAP